MNQYIILWVDDDFNNPELRPDREALSRMECKIIGIDNPDSFLDYIVHGNNQHGVIDCIIIDLSMPIGKKLRKEKTKGGTSTGLFLLEKVRASIFKDKPIVVYTITENVEVKKYCKKKEVDIPYWNKMDYLADEFATEIIGFIKSKREQKNREELGNV